MKPTQFPEANCSYGPPQGYDESQIRRVAAYKGQVKTGNLDGDVFVVVAWQPDAADLARLAAGNPIFFSCIGGLVPHFLTTDFNDVKRFEGA